MMHCVQHQKFLFEFRPIRQFFLIFDNLERSRTLNYCAVRNEFPAFGSMLLPMDGWMQENRRHQPQQGDMRAAAD